MLENVFFGALIFKFSGAFVRLAALFLVFHYTVQSTPVLHKPVITRGYKLPY
jgi:hypothetical protein